MKPFLSTLLAAAGLLATASCMVGPDYRAPEADVAEAWSGPDDAPERRSGDPSPRWWSELGDPTLDRLIDAACRSNLSPQEARAAGKEIVEAARARFRPILMTSFVFILGALPLVLATGAGASARKSLGITVVSGMLASTYLAVLFVPAFYAVLQRFAERRRGRPPAASPPLAREPASGEKEP